MCGSPEYSKQGFSGAALLREARAASALDHPKVPRSDENRVPQPSTSCGRSEQILLHPAGCETRNIPADAEVFFLDSPFIELISLDAASATTRCKSWLLVEVHGRPADALSLEVKTYVDMVGDLDERNAFVHSVIPTIEDHFPFNLA